MQKMTINQFKEKYGELVQVDIAKKTGLSSATISEVFGGKKNTLSNYIITGFEKGFGITLVNDEDYKKTSDYKNQKIDNQIEELKKQIKQFEKEKEFNNFKEKMELIQDETKIIFEDEKLTQAFEKLYVLVSEKIEGKTEKVQETKTVKRTRKTKAVETEKKLEAKEIATPVETVLETNEENEISKVEEETEIFPKEETQVKEDNLEFFEMPDSSNETYTIDDFAESDVDDDVEESINVEDIFDEFDSITEYNNASIEDEDDFLGSFIDD